MVYKLPEIRAGIIHNCYRWGAFSEKKALFFVVGVPGGIRLIKQYLKDSYCPVDALETLYMRWQGKLPIHQLYKLEYERKTKSLHSLASEYDVSYEAVRRALRVGSK